MKRGMVESLTERFAMIRADYNAAKSSRFRRQRSGLNGMGANADSHYRSEGDYFRMMELARDMDRNDVVVGQTVDRAVTNAVQGGIPVDAETGDPELNRELVDRWHAWGADPDQCDLAGELTWGDMEHLVLRSEIVDGDMIVLPTEGGSLQLVEAHRLRSPQRTAKNVIHGVLLDDFGKRMEYWITKQDIGLSPYSRILVRDLQKYASRDAAGNRQVFHVYHPKRASQTRGVTALAPIVDLCGMFEDINFAKLVQQQIVSCFAIFREHEDTGFGGEIGPVSQERLADGGSRTIEGIAPGMEITGRIGEKLTGFSPNVPNAEFFQHAKLILQLIGVNLGLPLALVLLDASETNFSGWRGAVDQARLGFRRNQRSLIAKFHRPVYLWLVRRWLSEDAAMRQVAAKSNVDVFCHRWNPPSWPYIEPLKDALASAKKIAENLTSPRRLHAEEGRDWDEVVEEIIEDRADLVLAAIERAEQINRQYPGARLDWRELAYGSAMKAIRPEGRDE